MCIETNCGVADGQGLGKQEKHKRKLELLFSKNPSASVNVLTSNENLQRLVTCKQRSVNMRNFMAVLLLQWLPDSEEIFWLSAYSISQIFSWRVSNICDTHCEYFTEILIAQLASPKSEHVITEVHTISTSISKTIMMSLREYEHC